MRPFTVHPPRDFTECGVAFQRSNFCVPASLYCPQRSPSWQTHYTHGQRFNRLSTLSPMYTNMALSKPQCFALPPHLSPMHQLPSHAKTQETQGHRRYKPPKSMSGRPLSCCLLSGRLVASAAIEASANGPGQSRLRPTRSQSH